MSFTDTEIKEIIDSYNNGEAMNSIAKRFHTYTTIIRRELIKNGVTLRHDIRAKGSFVECER